MLYGLERKKSAQIRMIGVLPMHSPGDGDQRRDSGSPHGLRPMPHPYRNLQLNCRASLSPWRVLSSGSRTFRRVFLFAPSAPAVQIFIPTMRAFDRSQLIVEIRQRFAARCCGRNRDDSPARSVLTQPTYVELARHHLLPRPDIDVAQRG